MSSVFAYIEKHYKDSDKIKVCEEKLVQTCPHFGYFLQYGLFVLVTT